jgi:hypothetical protein
MILSVGRAIRWYGHLTRPDKIKVRRHVYTRPDMTSVLTSGVAKGGAKGAIASPMGRVYMYNVS